MPRRMFASVSSSRCNCISRRISCSTRRRRNRARSQSQNDRMGPSSAGGREYEINGAGVAPPLFGLRGEGAFAGGGESVVLGFAIVFRRAPLALDEAFALESVESGVERALADLEGVARELLDALADA